MNSYHCMGTALQFLLNASMVFISSSVSSKSNTCRNSNSHQPGGGSSRSEATPRKWIYLEILLDAQRSDGLGDDDHVPLGVEADQDLVHN